MGRPREYGARKSTQVRLPVELANALTAAAAERDVSVNLLVEKFVTDGLARLRPVDEVLATRDPNGYQHVRNPDGTWQSRCRYCGVVMGTWEQEPPFGLTCYPCIEADRPDVEVE